ncbi:MAG: hypothetical protein JWL61_4097 [Gemmatimonadetes bacterium]|nr:hypothetical protein [Gemmatimonadota bacterium]
MNMHRFAALAGAATSLLLGSALSAQQPTTLMLRNNHELPYRGPIDLTTDLADGRYVGPGAVADVRGGKAHVFATLAAKSEITLLRGGAPVDKAFADGPLTVASSAGSLELRWDKSGSTKIGEIALGLVVIPGSAASVDDAVRTFSPLSFAWTTAPDGALNGVAERDGYVVSVSARPYGGGWLDVRSTIINNKASAQPAYVALVRRVVSRAPSDASLRFNGRVMPVADSPMMWDGDFRYVHGTDWMQWKSGGLSLLSVNGFTPVPSVLHGETWGEGSHFYVWELTRQRGDTAFLVSEIAGPNEHQPKKGYMAVMPYVQPAKGDTVALKWRLAAEEKPTPGWGESQLREFSGARLVSREGAKVRADIGVPHVTFGMSYFPYSTFMENFDFHRVPGLNMEGFWATSPVVWKQWRRFVPQMRTDLHIVRAMGFDMVRLHHLELLQTLDRADAFAFLDFYADETRALHLKWLVDTEGPAEWVTAVVGRYPDLVSRMEIENEILIPGIKPEQPARWSALYAAAKRAAPDAQVYLTGAGNLSTFERLRTLGVPFDRVGLHAYKHGPEWKEAFSSHMLGSADYATSIGKAVTLGEFNWKDLTRLSPEARGTEFAGIYAAVLEPRAIPEVLEFQFHEDLAFNPAVAGTTSRHYEPLGLDRRPKPEGLAALKLMREYERLDAPTRQLPIHVSEVRFVNRAATADFTVTNRTGARLTVTLTPRTFDGTTTRLLTPATLTIAAGATASGRVSLTLARDAKPGTYHHFIDAKYGSATSIGWGIASNEGAPQFAGTSVLGDRVTYAQGLGVVNGVKWDRPLTVIFGDKSPALELEDAYQLGNTLQAATGKPVRISSEKDLPDSLATRGTVFLVGTAATNTLIAGTHTVTQAGRGTIALHRDGGREWLVLTGADAKGVEAAVVELELRFWPNAKDAVIRVTGMEKGAALGNRAGGAVIDPP